jgi:hypothetical protein
MNILDVIALYEVRRMSLHWTSSEPKFSETGLINWALLPKVSDRNTQSMKVLKSFREPKQRRLRDEPCRASH